MRLAIFDIDGTLVRCSSEPRFWRFLLDQGFQGPRQLGAHLLFLLRYLPTGGGLETLRKNKAYLSGLRCEDIDQLAARFVEQQLLSQLFEPTVQRLRQHQRRGDIVVLMSGTLAPVAAQLAQQLGADHAWGTLAARSGQRYAARPPDLHPYAEAKLSLARLLAQSLRCELRQASAYADSIRDLPLLESVGEAVAVRPDARLERVAHARGWEVIEESGRVSGAQVS
jgi:HAD superfamily hydrolase (TIGR01490 family)